MPTNFVVDIPVANIVKMILDGAEQNQFVRYDQQRLALVENAGMDIQRYSAKMVAESVFNFEHYTNFPYSSLGWIDCDGTFIGAETQSVLLQQYTNLFYRATCMFSSIAGKLFIFFRDAQQFSDSDFLVPTDLIRLNGKLPPINAKVGDVVRYNINDTGFVFTTITDIVWSPTLQAQGYLINVDATLIDTDDGLVEINYNEREADLWNTLITVPATPGEIFLHLKVGLSVTQIQGTFTSEEIECNTLQKTWLAIQYRHKGEFSDADHWGYLYGEGYYNTLYMDAQFYKVIMAGENDVDMGDTGIERLLRSVPFRQLVFSAMNIPGWVADKLQVVFAHDTKVVNEYEWEIENFGSFETIERTDIGTLDINLRQKNDRTKFVNEFIVALSAEWIPPSLNFIFEGESKPSVFNANTGGTYHLINVPSWLHPSISTGIVDADIVSFVADENPDAFIRTVTVRAISDLFPGIFADIAFEQALNESEPEFLSVEPTSGVLNGHAFSAYSFVVNGSGVYEVNPQSGYAFDHIIDSLTGFRVFSSDDNPGPSSRVGVLRVWLSANHAIFVDITVIQFPVDNIFSVSPGSVTRNNAASIPGGGEDIVVSVNTYITAQWKATSPQSGPPAAGLNDWLHFNKSTQVGSNPAFIVTMDAKPPYVPNRTGTVTFYSIINPADAVVLTIHQNT